MLGLKIWGVQGGQLAWGKKVTCKGKKKSAGMGKGNVQGEGATKGKIQPRRGWKVTCEEGKVTG